MGTLHRLKQKQIESETRSGKYADGGGLYLQVRPTKDGGVSRSWLFRYQIAGVTLSKESGKLCSYEMGLGALHTVGLAEARHRAHQHRLQVLDGIDPQRAREQAKLANSLASEKARTFKDCAEEFVRAERKKWTNRKHEGQWRQTLADYVYPKIGAMQISLIETNDVLRVLEQPMNVGTAKRPQLEPLWTAKAETASRIRGRIEAILDWARVRKYRSGENPARWRDNLKHALPDIPRHSRIEHHEAVPFVEAPAFLQQLREIEGVSARALEFLILTAMRTSEVIEAKWSEVNLEEAIWTVPPGRHDESGDRTSGMKARKEHRVPLCDRAIVILREIRASDPGELVFPSARTGEALSNMAMLMLMRRLRGSGATVHGWRSTFRDWAAERTTFANHVVEMALAHTIGDKVEAAYRRGDLFEKRRKLMDAWAQYLEKPAATVTSIDSNRVRRAKAVA